MIIFKTTSEVTGAHKSISAVGTYRLLEVNVMIYDNIVILLNTTNHVHIVHPSPFHTQLLRYIIMLM